MKNNKLYRFAIPSLLTIGLLFFLFVSWQSSGAYFTDVALEKQKGVHVFGINDTTDFQFLHRNNVEWVTLVPWGFQQAGDSPKVGHHNGDSVYIRDSNADWIRYQKRVKDAGFKIFVKPHVWLSKPKDGEWRSDIYPQNDAHWEEWKTSYRDFILRYADLAEKAGAEMFCIGTEFSRLSVEKAAFWKALIQEIRAIYSGKLTYAANWYEEYEHITFWEDLDYIGVQAYFPLVDNENPSVQELSEGWDKYLSSLKNIHKKYNRPIIFTEMGYKSTTDTAIRPWEWAEKSEAGEKTFSGETQANCYQVFFDKVWTKRWFVGVHLWQMRGDYLEWREVNNLDFTPLRKPAEKVIAKGFE